MDNQTIKETARETLSRIREISINLGVSVYSDFIYISHNDYRDYRNTIDFDQYGYLEFCLFAEALNLFENNGYDELTKIIDQLENIE